jgi:hypothetical protein
MNDIIWNKSNIQKRNWVEKFKKLFILQDKSLLNEVFNIKSFGIHNSFNLEEYLDYELKEFFLKCHKFHLDMSAQVECFDLGYNLFYFALGKKNDLAVFEAIFSWDEKNNIAIGNQYPFKIEPKMQMIKNQLDNTISIRRSINLSSKDSKNIQQIVLSQKEVENHQLTKIILDPIFGGVFYQYSYEIFDDDCKTYLEKIKIYSNHQKYSNMIVMRGNDHPLFQNNCFPILSTDKKNIYIDNNVFPVIIEIVFEDQTVQYLKYPKEKQIQFSKKIKSICLTDTLSFDWIII